MARPKLFDRDRALHKAIGLFRQQSYAGTATEDLLTAMGISRQSMYDTFGNKRQLFLEALRRYNGENVAGLIQVLAKSASPRQGLEEMLTAFAINVGSDPASCMGISSICEFGRTDEEINTLNDASGQVLAAAIENAAAAAKQAGEITADLDSRDIARYMLSLLAGIKLSARAGASPAGLRNIISISMRSLR